MAAGNQEVAKGLVQRLKTERRLRVKRFPASANLEKLSDPEG